MMAFFLAWAIGSSLLIGYVLGATHEISRSRRRRALKAQRVPLLLRSSRPDLQSFTIPAGIVSGIQYGPELPDLSRWKRGGRQ